MGTTRGHGRLEEGMDVDIAAQFDALVGRPGVGRRSSQDDSEVPMPSIPVSRWRGSALRKTRPVSHGRILVGREGSTCDSSVSAVTLANPGVPNPRPSYQSMCPAPALLRAPPEPLTRRWGSRFWVAAGREVSDTFVIVQSTVLP